MEELEVVLTRHSFAGRNSRDSTGSSLNNKSFKQLRGREGGARDMHSFRVAVVREDANIKTVYF